MLCTTSGNLPFFLHDGHPPRPPGVARSKSGDLAPVVQRLDNFTLWISHYPTVSICAKISVFALVQAF